MQIRHSYSISINQANFELFFSLKFNDVSETLKTNEDLIKNYTDFAAYAIILQDKFKNYPSSLKSDLMGLAAKNTKAKCLMSKINGVRNIHRN